MACAGVLDGEPIDDQVCGLDAHAGILAQSAAPHDAVWQVRAVLHRLVAAARRGLTRVGVRVGVRVWMRRRTSGDGSSSALLRALPEAVLLLLRRALLDPVPQLGRLREQAPVSPLELPFGVRGWLVTGHAEARAVLAASGDFSNDFGHLVGTQGLTAGDHPGGLGFADPPEHTRLRKLVSAEFTARRLARLAPRIDAIVDGQLDRLAAAADTDGRVDLVEHFARPVPLLTICELLGLRDADRQVLTSIGADRFDLLGGTVGSFGAVTTALDLLTDLVRRERVDPGEGLLGALVRGDGAGVSDRALAGLVDGLLTGGLETTASMLALGTVVLLRDPATVAELRDGDEALSPCIEELLRYLSVVQVAFPRFARHDVRVGGRQIAAGDVVLCSLSAANRDPRTTPGGDRVDVGRPPSSHLAFGHGLHRCVGAELARMELRSAYPALLRRYPALRMAGPLEALPFRELSFVYGVDTLPVLLGPDGRRSSLPGPDTDPQAALRWPGAIPVPRHP